MGRPRSRGVECATVLAAIVVLGIQLFIPPRVGLANNGDFSRIIGVFGLGAPSEDEYAYADLKYRFDPRYRWQAGYYSSETLLAAASVGLNSLFSKPGVFDLRWMGFLHGLLLVLSLYLLQPLLADMSSLRRTILSISVVFAFGDFMYSSYLNSSIWTRPPTCFLCSRWYCFCALPSGVVNRTRSGWSCAWCS